MDERYKNDAYVRLSVSDAREHFSDAINRVAYGGQRVLLLRHGKPVAAIISFDDFEAFEEVEDALDRAAAEQAAHDEDFQSWDEFEAELGRGRPRNQAAAS